ncbi:unnamed protein product [Didymodactylos carnosus]|uniref:Uncharacterized protein n=1 Tax=Didymodactylos carnosus TaxID=1234261 RepID=A0A8S2TJD4_9BILA|nr:unnamed protein product [Didymodactylos carnosus]CAF4265165.1 unnamed protein product [Didymodactylos carnosus]
MNTEAKVARREGLNFVPTPKINPSNSTKDKGGKIVVLDIEYYKNKIHEKLHADTYQLLKLDPSEKIYKDLEAQLKSLEEKGVLETQMIQKFLKHKHLPIVKGQVKVHKQG